MSARRDRLTGGNRHPSYPDQNLAETCENAARGWDFVGHNPDYTMKLSPQPQAPLALGFSNTKPAVKSSSRQSIVLPTR